MSLRYDQIIKATVLLTAAIVVFCLTANAYYFPQQDTTQPKNADTLHYPIHDRRGDPFSSQRRSSFDLKDPANINDSIVYDPQTKQYYIIEKIGSHYYRKPTYLTFDEFIQIQARKSEKDYFQKRANVLSSLNKKLLQPKMAVTDNLFNRLFGNGKVEIRPQGNINIMAGYEGQRIENPALPERSRRTGNFAFNEDAQLSVIGNIGDKLRLPISYNTLANSELENQLKLDYKGNQDEIIKSIEAGNVSFSSKGSLIPGAQQLFGIKTQLQFGKLFVTGVLANQRSQRQSVALTGSSTNTSFELRANDYEENRHFLMAQYFRNNYNSAMRNLPAVNSRVQVLRVEVWVTNRNGSTTDTRDVVGLMDLGESNPYNPVVHPVGGNQFGLPSNGTNDLYTNIIRDPSSRNSSFITTRLNNLGLQSVQDFEKTYGRKLNPSEYSFNSQIGYLSLNQPLQPDEVLAVAYQYTYNGKVYQVGEFSQDVPPDTTVNKGGTQKVLFLKLLKATSQRTNLPLWRLMMKNIYVLKTKDGSYLSSIQPGDFNLNVLYEQPSLGQKRYLPAGNSQLPLLTLLNLDRLNSRNDPLPDGKFDYIEGYTVVSSQARIIFPTLEPFGRDLEYDFTGADSVLRKQYLFYPLYDTIKEIAKTYANLDRYIISGTAKGQSTSEISLGAYNVPPGSVIVTSGGQTLKENIDFTVDYNLGTVKIINQAIINSGVPVNVQYENNASYGIQQRNYMALRLDYQAKNTARESLNIGASVVRLGERPFFSKVSIGDGDPIRNTMYGVDFSYRTEAPRITRLLDKLPFYHTTEMSTITAYGEAAYLKPGHPPQIGKGRGGLIYIDDFEGSSSAIDLRFPLVSWGLASTPAGNGLFPEATLRDSLQYGFNRGKLAWYNIEPILQDKKGLNNPLRTHQPSRGLDAELIDPRVRPVTVTQIYPNKTPDYGQAQLITFDMAFYPTEKGPYNFNDRNADVAPDGRLRNPKKAWGGIMRGLDQVDFESANVEFIEFWLQDPFLKNPGSTGGQLYFDLGNVSEDVLKDGKRFFENGISGANTKALEDSATVWGKVPANPIQVTRAFSNDPADRPLQDAGFDGLDDDAERRKFRQYLANLQNTFGAGSAAYQNALRDPSADDFKNYRDGTYDQTNAGILERYKNVNSPQGNSPVASANDQYVSAFTLYPDEEEFNNDNTLNELEEYFEYKVDLNQTQFAVGKNFITDIRTFTPTGGTQEKWYLFRIPISKYAQKVGKIPDFKSIRFIRMYMTGFQDSVVLRFAKLELVRNQWRRFDYRIDTTGQYTFNSPSSTTTFNQLAVNVEQNSSRNPIPYRIPPGVERQQQLSNNNVNVLLNEQSLSIQVCDLPKGESRGVYKTLNLDLRRYGKLQMYTHAESVKFDGDIRNNELYAVIRLGSDMVSNYYEVRIPLQITAWAGATAATIWPTANDLDLSLDDLTKLKVKRNNTVPSTQYFKQVQADGKELAILGNPNLGEIRSFFLGVENRNRLSACTEVWFNELRLSELNEKGAWAALGRVDIKLADLGSIYVSGSARSTGFGTLEQRVNERAKDNLTQLEMATNLELGKLLPAKAGMSIPVYASYSKTVSTPEFDPYDLDIKLKDKLSGASSPGRRDSIRQDAIDVKTIKTVNFTNVKKNNVSGKKQHIWSIENVDVSYSYYKEQQHNPLIENNELTRHRAGLGYNYVATPKYWEPVKPFVRSRSRWVTLFRDLNINPVPSLLGFRADVNRQFGAYRPRNVGGPKGILPESYDKYFTFDRIYNLRWDITRSFNVDFSATNRAWVDEDSGRLDKQAKKRMWDNFWKGGRTISYTQAATFTYTLPTAKIPLLDWTIIRASYGATYNWLAASLLARNLGNTLGNTQTRGLTGEFDFTRLYSKSRWFRALDDNNGGGQPQAPTGLKPDTAKKQGNKNEPLQLNNAVKFAGRILTALKNIRVEYTENASSTIYGYTDSTRVLGMNFKSMAPGLGYVFGMQPDTNFINHLAQKGVLTHDPNFNYQNRQDFNQKLHITATVIPVRDLTIDINIDKSFGKAYSELYKDTTGSSGFSRLSPYASGSFSVSYISFETLFEKTRPNEVSNTFLRFQQYRQIISQRLSAENPYSKGQPTGDGYYLGYGRYAQDVIIPAFLAAYTKKDPKSIALIKESNPNIRSNPFAGILPKPNWQVTYTGLSRMPALQKIFTNFTISHGYNSTLGMNSFNSSLFYRDTLRAGYPGFVDSLTGNYIPYFMVPNISISEQFAPLISVDVQMVNQMTARVEFKKSRQLSLSLIDYQMSEARSTEYTIGAGWRKRGVFSFLKWKGKPLTNDANFRLDLTMRDESTSNSRLDQAQVLTTAGQKVFFINPSIDYVISNRVNVKLFYERRRVEPKISTSPPITTTRAGLQLRISLQ